MATKAAPEGVPPPVTSEAEAGEAERPAGEAGPAAGMGPILEHQIVNVRSCYEMPVTLFVLSLCYVMYYLLLFFFTEPKNVKKFFFK